MFKVNRKVEYALIALTHMYGKSPGELTSVKEICESYGSPFDVTSRSMQKLASAGILHSEKGAHGGYSILKDLAHLPFIDLVEILVDEVALADCLPGSKSKNNCNISESCNISVPMLRLNTQLRQFLADINVRDLIADLEPTSCCSQKSDCNSTSCTEAP